MKAVRVSRTIHHRAGRRLIKVLTTDKIVQSFGGKVAEQLLTGHEEYDNSISFSLAVDKILQNGGNIHTIVEEAEDVCWALMERNKEVLNIIVDKIEKGEDPSENYIIDLLYLEDSC